MKDGSDIVTGILVGAGLVLATSWWWGSVLIRRTLRGQSNQSDHHLAAAQAALESTTQPNVDIDGQQDY